MRIPLIAGNWKMNNTVSESVKLVEAIKAMDLNKDVEALVCVPFTSIPATAELLKDSDIKLGAQNMYFEEKGAYTGEVSPNMLKELGVEYVILGHSERREIFHEDDKMINLKVKSAFSHGLKPILCCGETLEEREAGKQNDKVKGQIVADLEGIPEADIENLVIAYEPIWAIGTGKTASSEDADEMIGFIRDIIGDLYGQTAKEIIRIQYGGSVKPSNIKEIMAKENIDGALVGGASLKADAFRDLVNF